MNPAGMPDMPDMPVNVPIDDPNADTEWNDILRKHGVIPEKPPSPTAQMEKVLTEARRLAHENRLEGKDLDELDELEDLEDEDFLESYRQKRMAEMNTLAQKAAHGRVYPITKPDWPREVTEASETGPVFIHLSSSAGGNTESRLLTALWRQLAEKYPELKFCEIRGEMAIENYPERNCPTILVYENGDVKKQMVRLGETGGTGTKLADLERVLVEVGAVKVGDLRMRKKDVEEGDAGRSVRTGTAGRGRGDDDDEWE